MPNTDVMNDIVSKCDKIKRGRYIFYESATIYCARVADCKLNCCKHENMILFVGH